MPELVQEETGLVLNLAMPEKLHWFVGREAHCDIVLDDPGVSRYHATIFRHQDTYYVVDHSLNGSHLAGEGQGLSSKTRLPTVSPSSSFSSGKNRAELRGQDTAEIQMKAPPAASSGDEGERDLNKSHAAFKREQLSTKLPRVVGYTAHAYKAPSDLQPLLEMIYSLDDATMLAGMGRTLRRDVHLVVVGNENHVLVFRE